MAEFDQLPSVDKYTESPPRSDGLNADGTPGGGESIELLELTEETHRVDVIKALVREKLIDSENPTLKNKVFEEDFSQASFVQLATGEYLLYQFMDDITYFLVTGEEGLSFVDDELEEIPVSKNKVVLADMGIVDRKYLVEQIQGGQWEDSDEQ